MRVLPPLLEILVCPKDARPLELSGERLRCAEAHTYRLVDGIPILLRDDVEHVHWAATRALDLPEETLVSGAGHAAVSGVHSFVQTAIGGTCGSMYSSLVGSLTNYPIPDLRAEPTDGSLFLDIGCNWGRWCIAASRAGFTPVGIDPSYEAVHAARSVARQLAVEAHFVVGDARHLPFRDDLFDFVFSYSVLQHLPREQVAESLTAIRRVLRPGGRAMIQMANKYGIRSLYHQLGRGFRAARAFEVRYWTVPELRDTFSSLVGSSETIADGYFSLNVQPSDQALLPARYRLVIALSEFLRWCGELVPSLRYLADSVYVISSKEGRTSSDESDRGRETVLTQP
jgi:SAM-dependent methyltransferase